MSTESNDNRKSINPEEAYQRVLALLWHLTAEQLQDLKLRVITQYQRAIPVVTIEGGAR